MLLPSGRSILRNAYTSYEYLNNLQAIEAIAVERELAGIPVARIPAEYLSGDASSAQSGFVHNLQQILRDVKFNEQGYIILPSDTYPDKDGHPETPTQKGLRLLRVQYTVLNCTAFRKLMGHRLRPPHQRRSHK